jgi:transcriptional antiterminator RfaH
MEVFYPRIRVKPINPRARKIRPYFPGYLFARADLDLVGLSTFQYMPYAIGIVCFDGEPAPVPDSLIHALIKRLETLREVGGHLFDGFAKGDPLQIREGPFEGYSAIFDARLSGTERVKVLLELLSGKYMSLELDAAYLKRT